MICVYILETPKGVTHKVFILEQNKRERAHIRILFSSFPIALLTNAHARIQTKLNVSF